MDGQSSIPNTHVLELHPPGSSTASSIEKLQSPREDLNQITPGALLVTLTGEQLAGNQEVLLMLKSGGNSKETATLPRFLTAFCQAMNALETAQPRCSNLVTLRRREEFKGRPLIVTGVLLPQPQNHDARQVLLTLEWSNTAHESSPPNRHPKLSKRENEIIRCLHQGLTNKEIASYLAISKETVKEYVKRIMKKTNCTTRTGIIGRLMIQAQSPSKADHGEERDT